MPGSTTAGDGGERHHGVPPTHRRYPFVTRMAATLFAEGLLTNVTRIDIEPEFGYVTRIHYRNGANRMTRANDVGLNSGAASDVVKDKAYTKFFLRQGGYTCPRGESFLLPWWADKLRPALTAHGALALRTTDQALGYVHAELPLPVYAKPVDGSKGVNVFYCADEADLTRAIQTFEHDHVKVALIEEAIHLPDFRLVILNGELISAYRRVPLAVTGDGQSTIAELLVLLQDEYHQTGRDTFLKTDDARILTRLRHLGLDLTSVPEPGRPVRLLDISNLSAGGTAIDHTRDVAPRWRDLAATIAHEFGLRFCGVDLACADLTSPLGDYAIIEVNGTPGLDHYGAVGTEQERIVRELYARVLNTAPRAD